MKSKFICLWDPNECSAFRSLLPLFYPYTLPLIFPLFSRRLYIGSVHESGILNSHRSLGRSQVYAAAQATLGSRECETFSWPPQHSTKLARKISHIPTNPPSLLARIKSRARLSPHYQQPVTQELMPPPS